MYITVSLAIEPLGGHVQKYSLETNLIYTFSGGIRIYIHLLDSVDIG